MPNLQQAKREGKCPLLERSFETPQTVDIVARNYCVVFPDSGLLGRYTVDKRTGDIRDGGSGRSIPLTGKLDEIRNRLIDHAQRSELSQDEALCCTRYIRAVEELGKNASIRVSGILPSGDLQIIVTTSASAAGNRIMRLQMDASTALARNADSGEFLDYADPTLRNSLILRRREPFLLPDEGARLATEAMRSIRPPDAPTCGGPEPNPARDPDDGYFFTPNGDCGLTTATDQPIPLTVNMYTGAVIRSDTNTVIESHALMALRRDLLMRASERVKSSDSYVADRCSNLMGRLGGRLGTAYSNTNLQLLFK
jgi:hypothetical protein